MKAYQIKIELIGSEPLIWRRVVMPAGATFNRLHDVIQSVSNFQGGYPGSYHLFEFELMEDNIRVTNDEEAYQEHKYFKKNRKEIEGKMKANATPETAKFLETQLKNLNTEIRKPAGIKIDTYIEKYGELTYSYDFGDNWQFIITLEEVVEDYKYGYPILTDGAETAPPEDVGGLGGYDEFLKAYHHKSHPEHEETVEWAEGQMYREYDKNFINRMLKFIKYKKNE
ncbi:plasmid pRiA4b ORF-3 family protein [Virgibacillus ainsalahensis]